MGFLSKLFRRKGGNDDTAGRSKKKKGKNVKKAKNNVIPGVEAANTSSVVGTSDEDGLLLRRQGSFENNSQTRRGSSSSREKEIDAALAYHPNPHHNSRQSHEQIRILSPSYNNNNNNNSNLGGHTPSTTSPNSNSMMSDQQMWNDEPEPRLTMVGSPEDPLSPRLSYQELQQFNSVQQTTRSLSPSHGLPAATSQPPTMFAMSSEIPNQQMRAMDDMDRSDASSSSFNLSTDAEDSEYEGLRRRGVVPQPLNMSTLMDTSVMSGVSAAHTTYTTDDDRIFPALQTDDDMTQATEPSTRSPLPQPQGLLVPLALTTPDDEPGRINISPMNTTDSYDDMRAWNISPSSTPASREPTSTKSQGSAAFSFQNSASLFENNSKQQPKTASNSAAAAAMIRSFTSPKSQASSTDFSHDDDFANFADFSNFGTNNMEATPWSGGASNGKSNKPITSPRNDFERNFETFDMEQSRVPPTVSNSQQQDSSLSELLAQAKNKQKRNSRGTPRGGRASSSSVNSAPAITASYLRQHHNLRSNNGNSYPEHEGTGTRASHDATSVSDIIHNLEATNKSRVKITTPAMSSHRSMGDAGATSTARTVKERLREKRRNEREHGAARGLQKTRSSDPSSSENSGDEEADTWLFDEVTGALGPRGIAADLESLSGRSRGSNGNKSHRSHKSHRSRASNSRRRPKSSSNESVDSRGSRASRYSHRSTKSFLSQMSEQSRSVANDLLRLEMQLAMVGSAQENRDDVPAVPARASTGGSVGGISIGGASRTSRTSRKSMTSHRTHPSSIARRNKVTVVAPPGKIGIILANKADTKGTVVSGVRTTSVLAEKVSPGDRIISIDGEDVSRMTVSEITTIMARKSEFERTLVVLTTLGMGGLEAIPSSSSPPKASRQIEPFDSSYPYRR